jgi:hypothetical protein
MEFTLKIRLDNDAYQGENMTREIAKNLDFITGAILAGRRSGIIHDSNGHKSGIFEINY